ncbi:AraC family transcriptional regulator [Thalassobacillus cyri]|uniref:AraC family transcriptional regulator n=1 Tax=Thalassobacillus cyri TaxID=571932 RepID=A0A1H3ZR76_9BACI|nr:AraC family transcriptional regulator [Thalassobacillus cyri]SEA25774.1 AraC family transcriptional regulator [Thalassobacillus cyri]
MTWVESLQRAIDYIEEHLYDQISMEAIADEANVSVFHFQRVFSLLTEISVGEYLRRRRMTLAAQELNKTNARIIDIAYKYGYDTPEAFSKAFRRQHGISPSEARTYTGKLQSYNRLVIQVSLKGAEPMQYKGVEQEGFTIVGIKRQFPLVNEENLTGIPKMWEEVNKDGTGDLLFKVNNGAVKGVLGVCVDKSNSQSNRIDYWIAAAREGDIPDGLSSKEISASKWAVFEVHGAMPDAIQNTWKKIFSEWFLSSGYEHAGTSELEVYTGGDPYDSHYYSEVWIPVK